MNDGHYLTKGHAVLCVLYMKTNLMSRSILGLEGTVLRRRQPLAGRRLAPLRRLHPDGAYYRRPCIASGFRQRESFRRRCVLFDTGMGRICRRFCLRSAPAHKPAPRSDGMVRRGDPRSMMTHHTVYIKTISDGLRGPAEGVVRGGPAAPFNVLDWYGDCRRRLAALSARLKISAGMEKIGA